MLTWKTPSGLSFVGSAVEIAAREDDCRLVVPEKFQSGLAEALAASLKSRGVDAFIIEEDIGEAFGGENPETALPPAPVLIGPQSALAPFFDRDKLWTGVLIGAPDAVYDEESSLFWWGGTDPADIPFLLRELYGDLDWPALLWHKAAAMAFCANDPDMLPDIVDEAPASPREFAAFLMKRPEYSNESAMLVKSLYRSGKKLSRNVPPKNGPAFQLWKLGLLDIGADGGAILHRSAMLAAGFTRELHQKLVGAQSFVYSPLCGEVHSIICRRLDNKIGSSWINREKDPENQKHRYEISPLLSYLQRHFSQAASREIEVAKVWGDIRHCVAHCNFTPPYLALKGCLGFESLRII